MFRPLGAMVLLSGAMVLGGAGGLPAAATRPAGAEHPPFDPATLRSRTVFVVPIKGTIGISTVYFVKRSIARAGREGAGVLLFEFDTPGGDLGSMIEICEQLGRLRGIPTVGFVNPKAISAGSIILAGMNYIYMAEPSTVGAAALVASSPQGGIMQLPERVREKYNSFVRGQVRALAERNGHPFALFQAMVDQDLEVSEVFVDGRREILTRGEIDNLSARKERGEIREYRIGELIVPQGKLLTLTNREAARWGLSRGTVADRGELLDRLGLAGARVVVLSESGSEKLARFLSHPVVVLALMVAGAIGIYVELNTPGFGVPGAVGIGAFAILFLGHYVAGLSGILEPLMFLVGMGLLAVEIFVTPGFGVMGAAGMLLMLLSIVLAGQDFVLPRTEFQRDVFVGNVATVMGGLVLSVVAMGVLARYLPRTEAFNRYIGLPAPGPDAGLHASAVAAPARVGERGRALTPLRPAGRARFGERFVDVLTEGQFVEPGGAVEVVRVDGNRVVVAPAREGGEGTA